METEKQFKPSLTLLDATMIVAGSMIGSGIFIVDADIVRNVGSAGWLILVWLLTGLMTLTAALSYGELSAMFPKAGGQYVYLREAFNDKIAFLYGWSFFSVIQTGTIAAVAVAFAKFSGYFFPIFEMNDQNILIQMGIFKIYPAQILGISILVLLTYINTRGVNGAKWLQTIFTLAKLIALLGLIFVGLTFAFNTEVWKLNWQDAFNMKKLVNNNWQSITGTVAIGAVASAMVGSIFSSDAWNNVTFIAGEIKNPQKNIGRSLFFGTLIVTIIYVSANLMYLSVLNLNEIANAPADRVAVVASIKIFGLIGTSIIAIMIMISTFGCNNGLILSGARVYYTMAKDGLFFKKAGTLNKNGVPHYSLWIQCVMASILCLSGRYGDLLDMVALIVVIFYILTIIGIFILRKKQPDMERPYKAIGYPYFPILYILMGGTFCVFLIINKPVYALSGLFIALLGIPLYYLAKKK